LILGSSFKFMGHRVNFFFQLFCFNGCHNKFNRTNRYYKMMNFSCKYNVAVFILPHMLQIQLNSWIPLLWDKTLRQFLIGWRKEMSSFQRDSYWRRVPGTYRRYYQIDDDAQRIVITTDVLPSAPVFYMCPRRFAWI
jgi:hypothetical protein